MHGGAVVPGDATEPGVWDSLVELGEVRDLGCVVV